MSELEKETWVEKLAEIFKYWETDSDLIKEGGRMHSEVKFLIDDLLAAKKKQVVEDLERIKLETDTVICDCGEKVSEWDIADLVNETLQKYKS